MHPRDLCGDARVLSGRSLQMKLVMCKNRYDVVIMDTWNEEDLIYLPVIVKVIFEDCNRWWNRVDTGYKKAPGKVPGLLIYVF